MGPGQRIRTYVVHGARTRPRGGKPLALYGRISVSELYFDRCPLPVRAVTDARSADKDKDKVSVRPYGVAGRCMVDDHESRPPGGECHREL